MRRLAVLPFLALGLLLPPAAAGPGNGPEPAETKAGDETPPGYQVRLIGAGKDRIKLAGASRIHLKGNGGRRAGSSNLNGLQLENCSSILVSDLVFSGWYQGIRLNGCKNIEFRNVTCELNRQQGWLANNSSGITLRHCTGSRTRVQHSFYSGCNGGKTADILIEDSSFFNSALAEVQVNAESGTSAAQRITLRRVKITNPTFSLNLLGAQQVVLDGCTIKSDKKAVSADRPYGRSWVSEATCIGGTTLTGKVYVGKGSSVKR
jgi:hypothetical protein